MATTSIEWTATRNADGTTSPGQTWNPVAGCTIKSAGCSRCYAMRMAARLEAMGQAKYAGTTKKVGGKAIWTGLMTLDDDALSIPLRRSKPTTWFVNSMSDLFWGDPADLGAARKMGTAEPRAVPFEFIDRVFAVMAMCPQHTFQVLTKRPGRMAEYLSHEDDERGDTFARIAWQAGLMAEARGRVDDFGGMPWPLPNVWLGTSVEDQRAADERIPHLLRCPAAVRFLSCEPLLGPLEFSDVGRRSDAVSMLGKRALAGIDWVIAGGESGPGARPCNVEWVRSIVRQCKAADVACFVKQLGAKPLIEVNGGPCGVNDAPLQLADKKGGEPSEWPADLRVREMPRAVPAAVA